MSVPRCLLFPRLITRTMLCHRGIRTSSCVTSGHSPEHWWGPEKAAGREVVGFGSCGDENYQDRLDYWYPAIRFRVDDDIIRPIKEKEKGDWKNLSIDEKKLLYRYSFKQTLAEFEAPTGYWKVITAVVLSVISISTFYSVFLNHFVYPPIPQTFDNEYKEAQIERILALDKGKFLGPAKYYDYENDRWKP